MVLFLSLQSVCDTGQVKILLHCRRRASNAKSQDQFCCWDHVVLSEPTGHSCLAMCNASPSPPSFCVSLEQLRSSQDGLHSHPQSLLSFLFISFAGWHPGFILHHQLCNSCDMIAHPGRCFWRFFLSSLKDTVSMAVSWIGCRPIIM